MGDTWNHTIKSKFYILKKSPEHQNGFRTDFNLGKCVLYFKDRKANYTKGNKEVESIPVVTTEFKDNQFVKRVFQNCIHKRVHR